jgi:hypothetical protein
LKPRLKWPSALFHACQLEVAAQILRDGELRCRNEAGALLCDVANQGALWANPAAHSYARLYFRPRNMFHLKTEGVKRLNNPHRVNPHMSMPVMLAFDFRRVLTMPESGFLYGNFAHAGAEILSGDEAFDELNFAYIYHDSPTSPDLGPTIREARMSEVVVPDAVPISMINAVICRTVHDLASLRHELAGVAVGVPLMVEGETAIFQKKNIFVRELYCDHGQVHLTLTAPESGSIAGVKVRLVSDEQDWTAHIDTTRFVVGDFIANSPDTVWTIEIEDCVAYRAQIPWHSGVI